MSDLKLKTVALAALLLLLPILLAACGDGDTDAGAGLTREEVQEIVRSEVASVAAPGPTGLTRAEVEEAIQAAIAGMPEPESGLTQADLEAAIRAAIAAMPQPEPGLTSSKVEELIMAAIADLPKPDVGITADEARRLAQYAVATVPLKTSPAEYTKFFVSNAISRYETEGRETTLARYNRVESIDDQWYVFIVDEDGVVISHFNAHVLGNNLNGPLGTDAEGYNFEPQILAATEEGAWVSYVYNNPDSEDVGDDHLGTIQLKHAWVVRHDGLLFGSGWYISSDEYTKLFVQDAIDRYHTEGLDETLAYYNSADSVFREWFAFIADAEGRIIAHYDPEMLGKTLNELLGAIGFKPTEAGGWVSIEDVNPSTGEPQGKHAWLISHDGLTFGSGWYHEEGG